MILEFKSDFGLIYILIFEMNDSKTIISILVFQKSKTGTSIAEEEIEFNVPAAFI